MPETTIAQQPTFEDIESFVLKDVGKGLSAQQSTLIGLIEEGLLTPDDEAIWLAENVISSVYLREYAEGRIGKIYASCGGMGPEVPFDHDAGLFYLKPQSK